jgi:ABC-type sugar transport system substrate-binding protein
VRRLTNSSLTILAPLVAAALALSSCGSSEGATKDKGETLSSDALLTSADEAVAAASAFDQDFPMPTEAAPGKDAKIAVMAGGMAASIHKTVAGFAADAVEESGATVLGPYDGEFTPSVQAGYIDQAVQDDADGIVLFAVDVNTISAAIDRALADGVAVACTLCYSGAYRDKGVIDVTPDFEAQGEAIGWNIIKRTEGKATVLVPDEPSQTGVVRRVLGITKVLDQCADCSYEKLTIPASDLALPGPPQFTAFLASKGTEYTDVAAYADALSAPILKTLSSTGNSDIVVSGYDAEETVVPNLADPDSGFVADMAAPMEYAAWVGVDQVLRSYNDLESWDSTDLPDVLLTPENVDSYEAFFAPEGDWKGEFTALWQG